MEKEKDLSDLNAKYYKKLERLTSEYLTEVTRDACTPASTKSKEARVYTTFIEEAEKFLGTGSGTLLFWVTVASLGALESLWKKSLSGALTNGFQREITTEESLTKMSLKSIKIKVQVRQEDYLRAKGRLQTGTFC